VRIQNTGVEQGYNTDANSFQFDEKGGGFTHSIKLSDLPIVVVGGTTYYEFVLDLHQDGSTPYLSLDELRLYVTTPSTPNPNALDSYDASTLKLNGLSPVFDMDGGADANDYTYVVLDSTFNAGSGRPDLFVDVPTAGFGTDSSQYVYLYSKFGVQYLNDEILGGATDAKNGGSANSTFEEWARGIGGPVQASGVTATVINQVTSAGGLVHSNVTSVPFGSYVRDTSTVTPSNTQIGTPTGTVTYYFYNTSTPVYPTTPAIGNSGPLTLVNGNVPNSEIEGPLAAGSYSFIAVYSGGPSSNGTDYFVGSVGPVEPLTVQQPSATISTVIDWVFPGGSEATDVSDVPLASVVHDSATITVLTTGGPTATDTVTYYFYNTDTPDYPTTPSIDSVTVTLVNGTVPESNQGSVNPHNEGPLAAGKYSFIAVYSGNYGTLVGAVEKLTVEKGGPVQGLAFVTTEIHTDPEEGDSATTEVGLGASVHDSATLNTATPVIPPQGTVTYTLSGAGLASLTAPSGWTVTGTGAATRWAYTVIVAQDGTVPESISTGPLVAGTDYAFVATFTTSDTNYDSATGDPEPLTVDQADTSTSTKVEDGNDTDITGKWVASTTVLHDSASVSSLNNSFTIGGQVTYTLYAGVYPNGTQVGSPETVAVGTESTPRGSLAAGKYYYIATYLGDSNYKCSTGDPEPFQINAPPTVVPHTYDCVNVGSTYSAPTTYGPGVLDGANDPDGGPSSSTAALVSGPTHNAASPPFVLNSNGSFSYTPDPAWAAAQPTGSHPTDSFQYKAFDGLDYSNVSTATLTINRAPVAVADNITTQLNVPVSGNLLSNDSDPDGTLTAEQVVVSKVNGSAANVGQTISLGGGSTVKVNADGTFTYTPGTDFHGSQYFTYTISDHCGLSSTTVTDPVSVASRAKTQGYWKNHETAATKTSASYWMLDNGTKVYTITIGGQTYTADQAVAMMTMSTGTGTSANAILMLWQQLVAAKLNVLNGVGTSAADSAAITDGDNAIIAAAVAAGKTGTNQMLSGNKKGALVWGDGTQAFVAVSSALGQRMVTDNNILDAFNSSGT
jgi:hypothetical protein